MAETSNERGSRAAESVGILPVNKGVVPLSLARRDVPTVICGLGRSGTSALAAACIRAGVPFVEDEHSANHESQRYVSAWRSGEFNGLAARTQAGYDMGFFCKIPQAEMVSLQMDQFQGNLIAVMRDPVARLARLESLRQSTPITDQLHHYYESARNIEIASRRLGVALVSYEKLLINPVDVIDELAKWLGRPVDLERVADAIEPDCVLYRYRQQRGLDRLKQDDDEEK